MANIGDFLVLHSTSPQFLHPHLRWPEVQSHVQDRYARECTEVWWKWWGFMVGHSPFWVRYRKKMVPFRIGRQCVCWSWWLRRWWFAQFVWIFVYVYIMHLSLYIIIINQLVYQALFGLKEGWSRIGYPTKELNPINRPRIPCLQTPGIDIFFVKQKMYFPKAKNSKKSPVFQALLNSFFLLGRGCRWISCHEANAAGFYRKQGNQKSSLRTSLCTGILWNCPTMETRRTRSNRP